MGRYQQKSLIFKELGIIIVILLKNVHYQNVFLNFANHVIDSIHLFSTHFSGIRVG